MDYHIAEIDSFFPPVDFDLVDGLISRYQDKRRQIESVSEYMQSEPHKVLDYFVSGNKKDNQTWFGWENLFEKDGAIAQLNADFWSQALKLTDILEIMPQSRRDQWHDQIRYPLGRRKAGATDQWDPLPLPDFEEETVRSTIQEHLSMRGKYFSERVDGVFKALSGTHVTNRPEGFGKRMILSGVIGSFGLIDHSKSGYINDLRGVIAKFSGRDEPCLNSSDAVLRACTNKPGDWVPVDGGSMRIRVYNGVGTAHIEVHPEMAWRLNSVLANIYPMAIPPKFRKQPKKKQKDFVLIDDLLHPAVIRELGSMKEAYEIDDSSFRGRLKKIKNSLCFSRSSCDKAIRQDAERVLSAIGGVRKSAGTLSYFEFDYDPSSVIDEIITNGAIPHQKSYQFYPTPRHVADISVDLAEIGNGHKCLEPSAGTGCIADAMSYVTGSVDCIEISSIHCSILKEKGYTVQCCDFTKMAFQQEYDRIVMNPPYSEGRWKAHVQHAADALKPGGRIVAILPESAKGKDLLTGFSYKWHGPYKNEFKGTGISVVILVADKGE